MPADTKSGVSALWIASGVLVWALHFTALYGFTALACARGFPRAVPGFVAGATLVAGALAAVLVLKGYRGRREFIEWMTASVAGLALVAIVYESITVLLVPLCE
jgi:hypothetical protein